MGKKYDPKNFFIKNQRLVALKKEDERKNKSQPEETIAEIKHKLREKIRQKADEEDLSGTSSLEGDDFDDFNNIPDILPIEDNEK